MSEARVFGYRRQKLLPPESSPREKRYPTGRALNYMGSQEQCDSTPTPHLPHPSLIYSFTPTNPACEQG